MTRRSLPFLLCIALTALFLSAWSLCTQAAEEDEQRLPASFGPLHMKAAEALEAGEFRDAIIALQGMEDPDARLLTGMARFGLKEYPAAARDLASYRQSREGGYAGLGKDEKDLYADALNILMLAYYHSDQLGDSLDVSEELMKIKSTKELVGFQDKLRREMKGDGTRLSESTGHFKVIYDGYEHAKVDRKVLAILEDAYREIGQMVGHFPSTPITVVLDTRSQFHDITRSPRWAGGLFKDGRIRIPVGGLDDFDESEVRRVLRHEYVHALIFSITPDCPRWVHEGLAEYISRGPSNVKGRPQVPLGALDGLFESHDVGAVAFAYVDSAKAVKALVDNYGFYDIKLFLESLGQGEGAEAAFIRRFYVTYDEFMKKFGKELH